MKKGMLALGCALWFTTLAGCGGGGGGGSSNSNRISTPATACSGNTCTIDLTDSGGHLTPSVHVGVGLFAITAGTCAVPTAVTAGSQYFASSSGGATLTFTITPGPFGSTPAAPSIWIDENNSGKLDNGDLVWGPSGTLDDICESSITALEASLPQAIDWSSPGFGIAGTSVWTGATQTF